MGPPGRGSRYIIALDVAGGVHPPDCSPYSKCSPSQRQTTSTKQVPKSLCNMLPQALTTLTEPKGPCSGRPGGFPSRGCEEMESEISLALSLSLFGWTCSHMFPSVIQEVKKGGLQKAVREGKRSRGERQNGYAAWAPEMSSRVEGASSLELGAINLKVQLPMSLAPAHHRELQFEKHELSDKKGNSEPRSPQEEPLLLWVQPGSNH